MPTRAKRETPVDQERLDQALGAAWRRAADAAAEHDMQVALHTPVLGVHVACCYPRFATHEWADIIELSAESAADALDALRAALGARTHEHEPHWNPEDPTYGYCGTCDEILRRTEGAE